MMRGIYIMGGYPDRDGFKAAFRAVEDAGFEFIEVGLPFSEPVADGAVIAAAAQHVLERGVTAKDILADVREVYQGKTKLLIMTYANVIYGYGAAAFSADYGDIVSGIILADVPNREHGFFRRQGLTVPVVPFVTPETRADDINDMRGTQADFVYYVGIRGVTGGTVDLKAPFIAENVAKTRAATGHPVIMGFGIKNQQGAHDALSVADGYVVGTEAVRRQGDLVEFSSFVQGLL